MPGRIFLTCGESDIQPESAHEQGMQKEHGEREGYKERGQQGYKGKRKGIWQGDSELSRMMLNGTTRRRINLQALDLSQRRIHGGSLIRMARMISKHRK